MESDSSSRPDLKFLNGFAEIGKHRNRLPHWQQDRVSCFVTFRLGDSIPSSVLSQWRKDRDAWLIEHPRPWYSETELAYHRKFSSSMDRWMDENHGSCLLADLFNAEIVRETLQHHDGADYLLHSWVIMPNHLHVLFSPSEKGTLPKIIAAWKRFSATRIHKAAGTSGTLWQKDYFDRLIRDWDHFINVARYIRRNPEKANLRTGSFILHEAPWVTKLLS